MRCLGPGGSASRQRGEFIFLPVGGEKFVRLGEPGRFLPGRHDLCLGHVRAQTLPQADDAREERENAGKRDSA